MANLLIAHKRIASLGHFLIMLCLFYFKAVSSTFRAQLVAPCALITYIQPSPCLTKN